MSKAAQPHDLLFGEVFSRTNAVAKFTDTFLPANLVQKMKLATLRPEPTSYVPPRLRRLYADLVYSCLYGNEEIELCLIKEHKSTRSSAAHFQLLDYVLEKWRMDRKRKRKRTPVLCILLYHGKEPWTYKPMSNYIKGMDTDLVPYNPLFDFILVNLNNYSDEFILSLNELYLVNALLLFKHSGDANYIRQHFDKIFIYSELYVQTDEGEKFVMSIVIYIVRTTDIREDEIAELAKKSPKIKNAVMKAYDVMDYITEISMEKGMRAGRQEGRQAGRQEAFEEMITALIRKGLEKKFTPEVMEDVYGIPLQKVLEIIARLKAEENGDHNPK